MSSHEKPPEAPRKIPAILGDFFEDLIEYLEKVQIVDVFGGMLSDAPGGGKRIVVTLGSGGGTPNYDQFQVILRNNPNPGGSKLQWGVVPNSFLYESRLEDDYVTITGLLSDDFKDGWLDIDSGGDDKIWLEIAFGTWPAIASYTISSLNNGGDFGGGEVEYSTTTVDSVTIYTQTFARMVLGDSSNNDDGTLTFIQGVKGPRLLMTGAETGYDSGGSTGTLLPVVYPYPK